MLSANDYSLNMSQCGCNNEWQTASSKMTLMLICEHQRTAAIANSPGTSVHRLVQSLQKALDNNNPPIWIVSTKEADICQSNLADSDQSSFMGITRHAGTEGHGFLLSVSKSLQEVEDEDMLLAALNLGKTLQNGDKSMNRGAIPLLKHYKTEDTSVFNDKNAGNMKFLDRGSRNDFFNHVMPTNLGRKQLPYPALKGAMAFPADTEIQNIESIQERETTDEENSAKFPIGRRDFDILRCMLGRVYRPCWQV